MKIFENTILVFSLYCFFFITLFHPTLWVHKIIFALLFGNKILLLNTN
ncbi:unnamed protein product [Acanthoscelides obtectus]|uniref:Uncharacterized protein n=1 Tax=Acanthoscelides obtectus TaxID=200917 RepID=A0A9P0KQY8_ACAOB|nr:unnamed protein product [Acanthoscelides obtectus]CAK1665010.1 hypothetical protein AOBTE_LOCUS24609 [Acanthoscelides obtectus]